MSNIVMGYKDHPAIRPDQDFANPTIANAHAAPSFGSYLQNTTDKVTDEVAMANQDLVLVLPASALKVPDEGFFGLFSALSDILSRHLSKVFDVYRYGWTTWETFPQSPRPV